MPEQAYWIIVSDEGPATKPKQHATYELAKAESLRLAEAHPGLHFGVFKFLGRAHTPKSKPTFYTYEEQKPYLPASCVSPWFLYDIPKPRYKDAAGFNTR